MRKNLYIELKKSKKIAKTFVDNFRISSIQSIITISFTSLAVMAMFFMGAVLYNKFSKTVEKNALMSTSEIMDQVYVNLQYYLKGMIEVSDELNNDLRSISMDDNRNINSIFNITLGLRKDIVTMGIFSNRGELIASTTNSNLKNGLNVKDEEWFRRVQESPRALSFSAPHVQNLFRSQHKWVVSLSREVQFKKNDDMNQGISLVDMNFSAINELCHNVSLGKRGYIYITDKDGNIIYHPQQQMIYAGIKNEDTDFVISKGDGSYLENFNGDQRVVSLKTVSYTGWRLVGISYLDDMVTSKNEIYYFFVLILLLGMILVSIISFVISARISKPIKKLEKVMKRVQDGEFNIYAEEKGEEEVKHLSQTFNIMITKIRELMEQIIKEQDEKRKNELKALQSQINPHFLYNTLDSIVWMAENEENKGVVKMVTALASFFRISISRGEEIISIKDELEHARNYLIIQQVRYEDKFDFDIIADDEVLKYKTQKLTLQPVIENAIYHGIKKMVDKGRIQITAEFVNDKICLIVIDNGLGMPPEIAASILSKESKGRSVSGIGVKNVNERIKLSFGNEYGLEIKSELDVGTCVKIWLPKQGFWED